MRKYGNLFTFFTLLCLIVIGQTWAFTPRPGSPMALHQHPRLHITQSTIPHFREVISAQFLDKYQEYVDWAFSGDDNDSHNILNEAGHDPLRALMVHQALIAAIGQVEGISYPGSLDDLAQRAINSLIRRLKAGDRLSYVAPLTYDWTYNFMSNAQRQQIADIVLNRTITHKVFSHTIANPEIKPEQMFSSKYYEGCYAWYIALAFWGDGLIDDAADRAVDTFKEEMLNYGYLDAANFVAGNEGGWAEWIGYSSWHPRTHFLNIDGWDTATGENYIANVGEINGHAMATYPKFMVYAIDPHKYFDQHYTYIRQGGAETTDCSFEHRSMREQMYILPRILDQAGYTDMAGLLRHVIDNYSVEWPSYEHSYIYPFLGIYRGVAEKNASDLNLPKSMWSKNIGLFLARTGFDDPGDGVFQVSGSHYRFDGHDGAADTPGFMFAKFGTLVNTRNVAHRGYGNLDDYPGARKYNIVYFEGDHTVSRHTMDTPSELQAASEGQGEYDHGGIEQVTQRNDRFYYVHEDRSRVLESGYTHTRDLVWLPGGNPQSDSDFLVVYDRTHSATKPEWVYHIPWEPYVSHFSTSENITTGSGTSDRIGNAYTGQAVVVKELNSRGGEQDSDGGKQDYVGSGGAHGVAFCRTLLPDQARVEVTRVAQFDDQVIKRQHHLAIKSHRWQVSVKAVQSQSDNRFLHIFQAADENNVAEMTNTSLMEVGSIFQGVKIENERNGLPAYVVLFSKNNDEISSAFTFTVDHHGSVRFVISGLKPFTIYEIKETTAQGTNTFEQGAETDQQTWNYKDGSPNITHGILYLERNLNGLATYMISPSGTQDVTPPSKPSGLHMNPK